MADDLPYKIEYAKSGRAGCKGCKTNIPQGSVRIAAMVQSPFFDGKQANWYHEKCFFVKQRPTSISEISNYTTLRYDDQEKIKKYIEENASSGVVMPVAKPKKGKGTKRAATSEDKASLVALKDFSIEYSKSSRATCRICEIKITKGEVRISKKVFDTEIGQKFGGQATWHHVKCFAEARGTLLYFASGELLPGFNILKKEDKALVKKELPEMTQEEVPIKKLKEEPKDTGSKKALDKEEKTMKEQSDLFYKYRDALKISLKKSDLQNLLEYNNQEVPPGEDRLLDRLADLLVFGNLKPCDVCKTGQLVLDTHGYKCTGDLTEWTKCQSVTQKPKREVFQVPDSLAHITILKTYKYKPKTRLFRAIAPSSTIISTSSTDGQKIKERKIPPLKNLEFYFYHVGSKLKEATKITILKLGGNVVSKFSDTLAAVISTPEEVERMSDQMAAIKEKEIQVLETSFFGLVDKNGTVEANISLITENNIASWGTDPRLRIPKDVIDGKSIIKSTKSIYTKSVSGTTKLKLKGGTAVDPESGLDDVAHVYKDDSGLKYSVVLGLTDVVSKKNSYYKLQLLQADTKKKYWLFRSWGRIGTTIGGNKVEPFKSLDAALGAFVNLYDEKTQNTWGDNKDSFVKQPGCMYPIDVDYGDDEAVKKFDLEATAPSILPSPVQSLIKMIFDVEVMKKVMLEFELDTEKMPLGKLSRKQLTNGYKVLTELLKVMDQNKKTDIKEKHAKIIDATNRFYTLIPHDFGIANPPLLDTEETIKVKTLMLDNLLELEIAYNLMKTGNDKSSGSPLDAHYIQLKTEIIPVEVGSPEFEMAKLYVANTHAATHSSYELEIVQLFKVSREGEDKRYKPFKKLHNRKLLWHGSRVTNFAGILSQGLRIAPPEAPVTGYMFGKGIYFADMVSKSANYCCTSLDNPIGVLLLCEVALGNMHELTKAEYVTKLPPGKNSVKGCGRTEPDPSQDKVLDSGTIVPLGRPVEKSLKTQLLYNEYIVYDVAQVNVQYLFQIKFNYKI